MTKADLNLAYTEHQVDCEHTSDTDAELPVCILLLISWKGLWFLCACQDTVLSWVPRSVLDWIGSGLGDGVVLLGTARKLACRQILLHSKWVQTDPIA